MKHVSLARQCPWRCVRCTGTHWNPPEPNLHATPKPLGWCGTQPRCLPGTIRNPAARCKKAAPENSAWCKQWRAKCCLWRGRNEGHNHSRKESRSCGSPRVGCTAWRPLVSAALPVAFAWQGRWLLRGSRGTWCNAKGSDVCRGVPWSPPLCRWLLCGRPGAWCSAARGRMHALASLGLRRGGFWVAGVELGAQGSDVRHTVPWSPPLCRWRLRGRCGTWCTAKGSDVRRAVPWSPPLCRLLLCGRRVELGALPRGRMYAVALPVAFAWQVRLGALQGVGCTAWRPLVSWRIWSSRRWSTDWSATFSDWSARMIFNILAARSSSWRKEDVLYNRKRWETQWFSELAQLVFEQRVFTPCFNYICRTYLWE